MLTHTLTRLAQASALAAATTAANADSLDGSAFSRESLDRIAERERIAQAAQSDLRQFTQEAVQRFYDGFLLSDRRREQVLRDRQWGLDQRDRSQQALKAFGAKNSQALSDRIAESRFRTRATADAMLERMREARSKTADDSQAMTHALLEFVMDFDDENKDTRGSNGSDMELSPPEQQNKLEENDLNTSEMPSTSSNSATESPIAGGSTVSADVASSPARSELEKAAELAFASPPIRAPNGIFAGDSRTGQPLLPQAEMRGRHGPSLPQSPFSPRKAESEDDQVREQVLEAARLIDHRLKEQIPGRLTRQTELRELRGRISWLDERIEDKQRQKQNTSLLSPGIISPNIIKAVIKTVALAARMISLEKEQRGYRRQLAPLQSRKQEILGELYDGIELPEIKSKDLVDPVNPYQGPRIGPGTPWDQPGKRRQY